MTIAATAAHPALIAFPVCIITASLPDLGCRCLLAARQRASGSA
jgi:hypothetical protein